MPEITLDLIKKLRAKTKAGVMDCRKALEASEGDMKQAEKWLRQKGMARAEKKSNRKTSQGFIASYSHNEGKIVAMVEVLCETDFVAQNEDFKRLGYELAMQVAAMNPKDVKALLEQNWIRDEKKKVESLVKEMIGKIGENIVVQRLARFELGEAPDKKKKK